MIDTDIEGLGPKEAYGYVLGFIATLKQTEGALAACEEDVSLWTRRVALASSRGDTALAAQAQGRLDEVTAKKATLEVELTDLRAKVAVLKQKLTRIRMTGERSVDTDLLLAQLEIAVGKKDDLSQAMKEEESKAALDELKKKMGQ
jgi:phage shock protein A